MRAVLVDLGHKSAFDLLLKEVWNSEQAPMGNSTLPTVIMAAMFNLSRYILEKLIASLVRELQQRDAAIDKLEERIGVLKDWLNDLFI